MGAAAEVEAFEVLRLVRVDDLCFCVKGRLRAAGLAVRFVLVDFVVVFLATAFVARLVELVFFLGFRDLDFFVAFLDVAIG